MSDKNEDIDGSDAHEIEITVPSGTMMASSGDREIQLKATEWLEGYLSDRFGGATTYTGLRGSWVDGDGNTVTETVDRVTAVRPAVGDGEHFDQAAARRTAAKVAAEIQDRSDEETVMWQVRKTVVGFE